MHDLSLHVLDLIENSIHAGATIVAIHVNIDVEADLLEIRVEDDGVGIQALPEEVLNPFYTTNKTKKVGLGLSFFKAAAELAGGGLTLAKSAELGGVAVTATMELTHVNRPPLGDLAATIGTMIFLNPGVDFRLAVQTGMRRREFHLSRFIKEQGLDANANVQLATRVLASLQRELEPWHRCEQIGWMERWQPGNGTWMSTK
jgi:hypothetical protein